MLDPTILKNLTAGGWAKLPFAPFREGIAISSLLDGSPAIAVLRYDPGARVPLHEHVGAETILVLEGAQSEQARATLSGAMTAASSCYIGPNLCALWNPEA